jgi:hypothetical protein
MRWIIAVVIASIVISAAFILCIRWTQDIWVATNTVGVLSFLYIAGLVYVAVRPPASRKMRGWTLVVAGVVCIALGIAWTSMCLQTRFQYNALHMVRKVIFHGVMHVELQKRALETFAAYHQQSEPKERSLGDLFREHNPLEPGSSLLDSLYEAQTEDGDRVHLASLSDTLVVLIGQSTFVEGEDPSFRNFDGRMGMVQDQLRLTTKGVDIEIQN